MLRRGSIRFQIAARRLVNRMGMPQYVGRGLAAGAFAAMFPLFPLRLVLSLLIAWGVRGSRLIAAISQLIFFVIGAETLATIQFWMGNLLWRGPAGKVYNALYAADSIHRYWRWSHPIASFEHAYGVFQEIGVPTLAPWLIGVLITAILSALAAYPIGVIFAGMFYVQRLRRRERRGLLLPRPHGMVVLPAPTQFDETLTVDQAVARYALRQKKFVRAETLTLLIDGPQAYPEMLRAIEDARESVEMETYILQADHTGERFSNALCAAARRGLSTRLLYDCVGAFGLPYSYVAKLLDSGVRVGAYKPLTSFLKRSLLALQRRDHRKILVVDGRVSFTGGLNISDHNAPRSEGGAGWRDMHVRMDGAAPARQFRTLYEETWKKADIYPATTQPSSNAANTAQPEIKKDPGIPPTPIPPVTRDALVQVLSNKEFLQRVRLRQAYVHAIRKARRYILLENAYFVPDRGIRRELYRAVKRGVSVSAGVAMYSDVKVVAMASRSLYSELLSHGVRLFEYPVSMLHSKVAVIDDIWSMIGSYNLDHRSLMHNLEVGALIVDKKFAERLRDQITSDIRASREVTQEYHDARPWDEMLLETLAYQVRYWL